MGNLFTGQSLQNDSHICHCIGVSQATNRDQWPVNENPFSSSEQNSVVQIPNEIRRNVTPLKENNVTQNEPNALVLKFKEDLDVGMTKPDADNQAKHRISHLKSQLTRSRQENKRLLGELKSLRSAYSQVQKEKNHWKSHAAMLLERAQLFESQLSINRSNLSFSSPSLYTEQQPQFMVKSNSHPSRSDLLAVSGFNFYACDKNFKFIFCFGKSSISKSAIRDFLNNYGFTFMTALRQAMNKKGLNVVYCPLDDFQHRRRNNDICLIFSNSEEEIPISDEDFDFLVEIKGDRYDFPRVHDIVKPIERSVSKTNKLKFEVLDVLEMNSYNGYSFKTDWLKGNGISSSNSVLEMSSDSFYMSQMSLVLKENEPMHAPFVVASSDRLKLTNLMRKLITSINFDNKTTSHVFVHSVVQADKIEVSKLLSMALYRMTEDFNEFVELAPLIRLPKLRSFQQLVADFFSSLRSVVALRPHEKTVLAFYIDVQENAAREVLENLLSVFYESIPEGCNVFVFCVTNEQNDVSKMINMRISELDIKDYPDLVKTCVKAFCNDDLERELLFKNYFDWMNSIFSKKFLSLSYFMEALGYYCHLALSHKILTVGTYEDFRLKSLLHIIRENCLGLDTSTLTVDILGYLLCSEIGLHIEHCFHLIPMLEFGFLHKFIRTFAELGFLSNITSNSFESAITNGVFSLRCRRELVKLVEENGIIHNVNSYREKLFNFYSQKVNCNLQLSPFVVINHLLLSPSDAVFLKNPVAIHVFHNSGMLALLPENTKKSLNLDFISECQSAIIEMKANSVFKCQLMMSLANIAIDLGHSNKCLGLLTDSVDLVRSKGVNYDFASWATVLFAYIRIAYYALEMIKGKQQSERNSLSNHGFLSIANRNLKLASTVLTNGNKYLERFNDFADPDVYRTAHNLFQNHITVLVFEFKQLKTSDSL